MVQQVESNNNAKYASGAGIGVVAGAAAGVAKGAMTPKYDVGKLTTLEKDAFNAATKKASESSDKDVKEAVKTIEKAMKDRDEAVKAVDSKLEAMFGKGEKAAKEVDVKTVTKELLKDAYPEAEKFEGLDAKSLKAEAEKLSKEVTAGNEQITAIEEASKKITGDVKEVKMYADKEGKLITEEAFKKLEGDAAKKFSAAENIVEVGTEKFKKGEEIIDKKAFDKLDDAAKKEYKEIMDFKYGEKTLGSMKDDAKKVTEKSSKVAKVLEQLGGKEMADDAKIAKDKVKTIFEEKAKTLGDDVTKAFEMIKKSLPKATWSAKIIGIGAAIGLAAGLGIAALTGKSAKAEA